MMQAQPSPFKKYIIITRFKAFQIQVNLMPFSKPHFRQPPLSPFVQTMQSIAGMALSITGAAPLVSLSYGDEMALKQKTITEFFRTTRVEGDWEPLAPSPFSRLYRTTTKRRVIAAFGKYILAMGEGSHERPGETRDEARLEPRQHTTLYEFLLKKLNEPLFSIVARRCNYLIVRGSYKEFCIIFNMHKLDGPTVRRLRALAQQLATLEINVISSFVTLDPTRSKYYIDKREAEARITVKKLFGPDTLRFEAAGRTYLYDALSFSQINQSMVPLMLKKAAVLVDAANPACAGVRLIDLYCGYGLFTLYLGKHFAESWGMDCEAASIRRGRESVAHFTDIPATSRIRFMAGQITGRSLEEFLPTAGDRPEMVVLDPPRRGTTTGVIGAIASRGPVRVLHIFCNIDIVPEGLLQWKQAGYHTVRVVPLDMFPGTPNIETMVLLEPG
jgi:tRNA/tmRNA/rRNA uracil-C5-methylase (TrmA/RlmC/RlmD family)